MATLNSIQEDVSEATLASSSVVGSEGGEGGEGGVGGGVGVGVGMETNTVVPAIVKEQAKFTYRSSDANPCWKSCSYCQTNFKDVTDFIKHLRQKHCTREGGSFVCQYGLNGVCPSLPLDGVSDTDYDAHVVRYHANILMHKEVPVWTVFSAIQNLPAVLNDPIRGKQNNFFTKKWGLQFIDKCQIAQSTCLPVVNQKDFEKYSRIIGKRHRRHENFKDLHKEHLEEEILLLKETAQNFNDIPEIFFKENLNLKNSAIFMQTFPDIIETINGEQRLNVGRQLQERLSHYLDIIEVKIGQQVSQKSAAFFHAMTSQDVIMSEMNKTAKRIRSLRNALKTVHESTVSDSFRVLYLAHRRQNYEELLDKLQLIITVQKTQPMLQLLLATQDYVAALDLIDTTQEIINRELIGAHCLRHLPMQLLEMEKLIDKMLITEFERYTENHLLRPLSGISKATTDSICAEEDKLVAIVMGLLRKKNFKFVDIYKREAMMAVKTIIKQLHIEFIANDNDGSNEVCLRGLNDEAENLSLIDCITLLDRTIHGLLIILQHIKNVIDIMKQTVEVAAGSTAGNLIDSETFLNDKDKKYILDKLHDLLNAVTCFCLERCANLISKNCIDNEIANVKQIEELLALVEKFHKGCDFTTGAIANTALDSAVQLHANKFANHFHNVSKKQLSQLLDGESWRQAAISKEFQQIIDELIVKRRLENSLVANLKEKLLKTANSSSVLLVESDSFTLVKSAIILVQLLFDYCSYAQRLPIAAVLFSHNIICLLRFFNSRSYQLVIGIEAVRMAGLKTITCVNLALLSRSLEFILWLLPYIRNHLLTIKITMANYDAVVKDYQSHIKEIEKKIIYIINTSITIQLENWLYDNLDSISQPSKQFLNISEQLIRFHTAIEPIIPKQQLHDIYLKMHLNFKDKFRKHLIKLNLLTTNLTNQLRNAISMDLEFYLQSLRKLDDILTKEDLIGTCDFITQISSNGSTSSSSSCSSSSSSSSNGNNSSSTSKS